MLVGLSTPCHLKVLCDQIHLAHMAALVRKTDIHGRTVRYLDWPSLVVEQLVLGAHSTTDPGQFAAFRLIRHAMTAGHAEIELTHVPETLARPAGQTSDQYRSARAKHVQRGIQDKIHEAVKSALEAMLTGTQGVRIIMWWKARLFEGIHTEASRWEKLDINKALWNTATERKLQFANSALSATLSSIISVRVQPLPLVESSSACPD